MQGGPWACSLRTSWVVGLLLLSTRTLAPSCPPASCVTLSGPVFLRKAVQQCYSLQKCILKPSEIPLHLHKDG